MNFPATTRLSLQKTHTWRGTGASPTESRDQPGKWAEENSTITAYSKRQESPFESRDSIVDSDRSFPPAVSRSNTHARDTARSGQPRRNQRRWWCKARLCKLGARSLLAARQRDTALRLKLATRRTTTARLIDTQENSGLRSAESKRGKCFASRTPAHFLTWITHSAHRCILCPSCVQRSLAVPRPCAPGRASSSRRPCTTAVAKQPRTTAIAVTAFLRNRRKTALVVYRLFYTRA